jgi:predicted site-specific integrase-resolvase
MKNEIIIADNYMTSTAFAKAVGVHPNTVRAWERDGKLVPHHRTPGGRRMYSKQQVEEYFNPTATENETE